MSISFVRGLCITTVTQQQKGLMLEYPMLCLTLKHNGAQLPAQRPASGGAVSIINSSKDLEQSV